MSDPWSRPEVREAMQSVMQYAQLMRELGIGPKQVQSPPGPAGFLLRLSASLADVDCPCGGEHLASDHNVPV